ncbi:MAG: chromate efflux transporter, partial [Actinobacteria bacterium]|nr:chromate efflux transporter [Actinomycetota bacterium]
VQRNSWLSEAEFEDGIAATSLLPGPASTQLAIFCGWRLAGPLGAIVAGSCFIVPGLVIIIGLSVLYLEHSPPDWVTGAAAGAGAAVPAIAVSAAIGLVPASWRRAGTASVARVRWIVYLAAGAVAANVAGEFLVVVLLACGLLEWSVSRQPTDRKPGGERASRPTGLLVPAAAKTLTAGAVGSLAWVALKVGALSFGGGFVIIPLMQHDAVHTYHWMTTAQFLGAVALGQVTPGPVVLTVGVVGYAAAGVAGCLLAVLVAFAPSFAFVMAGGRHFDAFRRSRAAQAFLGGAGPAAIGAIGGAAITLGLGLTQLWQVGVLVAAGAWLLGLRRGVVAAILGAGIIGMVVALAGGPI